MGADNVFHGVLFWRFSLYSGVISFFSDSPSVWVIWFPFTAKFLSSNSSFSLCFPLLPTSSSFPLSSVQLVLNRALILQTCVPSLWPISAPIASVQLSHVVAIPSSQAYSRWKPTAATGLQGGRVSLRTPSFLSHCSIPVCLFYTFAVYTCNADLCSVLLCKWVHIISLYTKLGVVDLHNKYGVHILESVWKLQPGR